MFNPIRERYPTLRDFVWIHDQKIESAIERSDLSVTVIEAKRSIAAMYDKSAVGDFVLYRNNQPCEGNGVSVEDADTIFFVTELNPEDPLVLKCTRNTRPDRAKWYCADIINKSAIRGATDTLGTDAGLMLKKWAFLGSDLRQTLRDLKKLAHEENWDYATEADQNNGNNIILWNYLKYTFAKLWKEGKVVEGQNFAAFNTGLVDRTYEYIYAVFKPNPLEGMQKWRLEGFCVPGGAGLGKDFVRNFKKPFPEKATYFKDKYSMLYELDSGKSLDDQEPDYDFDHVILDNTRRLPKTMLEDCCYDDQELKELLCAGPTNGAVEAYWKHVAMLISGNDRIYRRIKQTIDAAITLAIKRVDWNFKTAIPMYYPKRDIMSLLLPLSVVDEKQVDIALVVERARNGNYIGHTILTLDWAYNNARLVCKPESDWLKPEIIRPSDDILAAE